MLILLPEPFRSHLNNFVWEIKLKKDYLLVLYKKENMPL